VAVVQLVMVELVAAQAVGLEVVHKAGMVHLLRAKASNQVTSLSNPNKKRKMQQLNKLDSESKNNSLRSN